MSIQEFLNYIDLSKSIFMSNDESGISIPFLISYPSKNEAVIIYSLEIEIDKYTKIFKDNLQTINYDLSSLTKVTQVEILEGVIGSNSYYIINDEFYINK